MFESYQKIDDEVDLYYKVYGSEEKVINKNQPTLIFLHGGPGVVDHSLYVPFWSQFAGMKVDGSTLQVIFIDHRGNGKSFKNKNGIRDYGDESKWNLKQWGEDVYRFFTALEIVNPIIAGVSFGGVVAMSCAAQYPKSLGGLILCDTDAKFDLDLVIQQFAKKVVDRNGSEDEIQRVCAVSRKMFTSTTAETYEEYVKICVPYCATKSYDPKLIEACVKNEASAYIYNQNELTKYNYLSKLSSVECPVLLISGDQNPVHNAMSARKTASSIRPDLLTFKLFEGAGSPVYSDCHDEVSHAVVDFILGV